MTKGWRLAAVLVAAITCGCGSFTGMVTVPHVTSFSSNAPGEVLPQGWEPWTLSRLKKTTQYALVDEKGKTVVKAHADAAASGLIHPLSLSAKAFPVLSWRWKVTDLIAGADNTQKHTEDSPVRVVITFDGDSDKLPMTDRIFADNMKLLSGQKLPYATLMYIWENRAPAGTVIPNRHTSRVRMIVAESGREKVGNWQEVTRNVYEDYKRVFGEEPGQITAIGIMTDTDNTGANVHAYYGDIVFSRPPRGDLAHDTDQ
jgi:DUF3047 family protein